MSQYMYTAASLSETERQHRKLERRRQQLAAEVAFSGANHPPIQVKTPQENSNAVLGGAGFKPKFTSLSRRIDAWRINTPLRSN